MGFCNCCNVLLCVTLCPFWFSFRLMLDGKERAGCFALFVFLVSLECCVTLPDDATGGGGGAVCECVFF